MGECHGLPQSARPACWEANSRATQSGFHSNLCNDALIRWPNQDVELRSEFVGHLYASRNALHPFGQGLEPTGQRPIYRTATVDIGHARFLSLQNLSSEQQLAAVLARPAADPNELCEVFATWVVDRSGWGGLYRVHRRRRWRRSGPDGPQGTGSGQIVLTGSVLRRHRHHLSRAAWQRPSSGYDRTCPDVPPPI